MTNQKLITDLVKNQYEQFPYPPIEATSLPPSAYTLVSSFTLAQYVMKRRFASPEGIRILVAGCGTGTDLQIVAQTNPGAAEIIGIDLSQASISQTQQRIRHHNLNNCRAYVGNLLDATTLPSGSFDMITAYGVLHHTADPSVALKNLAAKLKPDGVMGLMLYNSAGRWIHKNIGQALEILGIMEQSPECASEFIQQLLASANPKSILASHAKAHKDYYQEITNIVDTFLHPQNLTYSISEIVQFLETANLKFLDIVQQADTWQPEDVITRANPEFYAIYDNLDRVKQLTLLELLHPMAHPNTEFWCCFADQPSPPTLMSFEKTLWCLNPLFIDHATLALPDQNVPFKAFCLDPYILTQSQCKVRSRLFCTESSQLSMSRYQLKQILLPLFTSPRSGEEILSGHDQDQHEWIKSLFDRWEHLRITLRA
jgi:2-polyprenyl-3-methyl-5-hydroxy-6-metoxy-1,4-benzoquinol methylase